MINLETLLLIWTEHAGVHDLYISYLLVSLWCHKLDSCSLISVVHPFLFKEEYTCSDFWLQHTYVVMLVNYLYSGSYAAHTYSSRGQ